MTLLADDTGSTTLPPIRSHDSKPLYVKAALTGDEPDDVLRYKRVYPDFPHETTGDQFFSEAQFESYRALGFHSIEELSDGFDPDFFASASQGLPNDLEAVLWRTLLHRDQPASS